MKLPMPAPAIDSWTRRFVTSRATIIRTMAPRRSDQGARLNNSHHTMMANVHTAAPINPYRKPSGMMRGNPNLDSNSSEAAITPGHSRSGFCGVDSSTIPVVIANLLQRITIDLIDTVRRHLQKHVYKQY